jgi:hypothetical protein
LELRQCGQSFRFVVFETTPPYALAVVGLGPDALALTEKRVRFAIELWRQCLDAGAWPAYPTRTCWSGLQPAWEETRRLTKELRA